jgi:[CysO sulfur-carrier protein]-S-L-cysteine hydrolase
MTPLRLSRRALDDIFAHARAEYPNECCGAVVHANGRDHLHRFTNIQDRLHAENPTDAPRTAATAYTPEPKELLGALQAGDAPGACLTVFYHSHPPHASGGAYFSSEDQARAMFGDEPAYPDVTYVVVSDARVPDEARAFRWDEGGATFAEVPIEVVP